MNPGNAGRTDPGMCSQGAAASLLWGSCDVIWACIGAGHLRREISVMADVRAWRGLAGMVIRQRDPKYKLPENHSK
jgi:hypothetical protein